MMDTQALGAATFFFLLLFKKTLSHNRYSDFFPWKIFKNSLKATSDDKLTEKITEMLTDN